MAKKKKRGKKGVTINIVNPRRRKRSYKRKTISVTPPVISERFAIEKSLIENFVSLQRIMVNLSGKFDNLASQISKLLNLFEISAKVLAEKDFDAEANKRDNARIIEKLDGLMDQNRTIARGLTMMHEKINVSPIYQNPEGEIRRLSTQKLIPPKPLPRRVVPQKDEGEYHKSISSNEPKVQ